MKYVPTAALKDLRDQLHSKALVDWNSKVSCDGMVVHLDRMLDAALDAVPVAELKTLAKSFRDQAASYGDSNSDRGDIRHDLLDDCADDVEALIPGDPPPATLRTGEKP